MQSNHHQLNPGDLSEYPRPSEKEIRNQPVYTGHMERAESFTAAAEYGSEKGARL